MVESPWLNNTSPLPSESVSAAVRSLIKNIFETWKGKNALDRNLWVVPVILQGSLTLYVALLALVRATPGYRMLCLGALFVYSWYNNEALAGVAIFAGAILAELSMVPTIGRFASSSNITNRILPFVLVTLGLYLSSFPSHKPTWAGWSNTLEYIGRAIFPKGSEIWSAWASAGSILLLTGIVLSEPLQKFLSHPAFLYLGAHSFPIYLIHGPLLRSTLNWMLYMFIPPEWSHEKQGDNMSILKARYPIPPAIRFVIAFPIFFALLLWLAQLWTAKIEPQCGRLTKWLEDTVCGSSPEIPTYQMTLKEFAERSSSSGSSQSSSPTLNEDVLPR
ncbi:hypothetical protein FKW77_004299 [Venturia effusa]|uniref:Acyltransferase 3 domain-containing protein n=1 Tax=Venturia effusa TaxID=50376 RepID=A0A517L942_9PEZI|nr:hypothetical protein FKW77_004299 [Venturia effusa]